MTREEAIKTLRELWRETNDSWYEETYNMAIEALQRTSNAHPTHECVKPTHECDDLISREAALDAISTFGNREYRRKQGTLRDAYKLISALPYEHVGNSDMMRPKGEWIDVGDPLMIRCSKCDYRVARYNNTNYCPNCGARMKGADDE